MSIPEPNKELLWSIKTKKGHSHLGETDLGHISNDVICLSSEWSEDE